MEVVINEAASYEQVVLGCNFWQVSRNTINNGSGVLVSCFSFVYVGREVTIDEGKGSPKTGERNANTPLW